MIIIQLNNCVNQLSNVADKRNLSRGFNDTDKSVSCRILSLVSPYVPRPQ